MSINQTAPTFTCVDCKRSMPAKYQSVVKPYGQDGSICTMCLDYYDYLNEPYPVENTCSLCGGWKEEGYLCCEDCHSRYGYD